MSALADKVVVVAGAAGPAGQAAVRRLAAGGAQVIAADVRPTDWEIPHVTAAEVDLLDFAGTRAWAAGLGRVDGVVHVVGGWRGGKTFAETDLADWDFLHDLLVRTLQHTSLAFAEALRDSPDGRFVIVSQPGARRPTQGNAAYATAKAAAEAWTLALADSFAGSRAAAAILVVNALLTDAMRAEQPSADFAGFIHVDELAERIAALWERPATELNGHRIDLASA
jgi:NAD(P)-dependent dehydrogenase (short-subunit alcohol dehydrogenase family)